MFLIAMACVPTAGRPYASLPMVDVNTFNGARAEGPWTLVDGDGMEALCLASAEPPEVRCLPDSGADIATYATEGPATGLEVSASQVCWLDRAGGHCRYFETSDHAFDARGATNVVPLVQGNCALTDGRVACTGLYTDFVVDDADTLTADRDVVCASGEWGSRCHRVDTLGEELPTAHLDTLAHQRILQVASWYESSCALLPDSTVQCVNGDTGVVSPPLGDGVTALLSLRHTSQVCFTEADLGTTCRELTEPEEVVSQYTMLMRIGLLADGGCTVHGPEARCWDQGESLLPEASTGGS